MKLTRRSVVSGLAAVSLIPLISGCRESQSPAKSGTLRLQASWINDAEFLGYFAGLDKKFRFYEKMGISLNYLSGGPQVIPESSLLNGKAEIALTTPETTAQYILRDNVSFVIIGAQYQKSPIGIVSLARNPVSNPDDLRGKRLAVAPVSRLSVEAMFRLNGIKAGEVELIPYTYDPQILINGTADATVDFVTNVPYAIKNLGEEPVSFLLYDAGFKIFNDTLVVKKNILEDRFDELTSFLAASMLGWDAVYENGAYEQLAQKYATTWFSGTKRTVENEIEFAKNQFSLMEHSQGFYYMAEDAISENIRSLAQLGLEISPEVFDTRVFIQAQKLVSKFREGV